MRLTWLDPHMIRCRQLVVISQHGSYDILVNTINQLLFVSHRQRNQMNELNNFLHTMIDNTEAYCGLLLTRESTETRSLIPGLKEGYNAVIDGMLRLYDTPEFAQVREDKAYWMSQRERISDALESADVFFTIDGLKNETGENFKLFLKMTEG